MRITITIEDGVVTGSSQQSTSDTPGPPAELLAAAAAVGAIDGGPAPTSAPTTSGTTEAAPAEAATSGQDMSAGPAPGTRLEAAPDTVEENHES